MSEVAAVSSRTTHAAKPGAVRTARAGDAGDDAGADALGGAFGAIFGLIGGARTATTKAGTTSAKGAAPTPAATSDQTEASAETATALADALGNAGGATAPATGNKAQESADALGKSAQPGKAAVSADAGGKAAAADTVEALATRDDQPEQSDQDGTDKPGDHAAQPSGDKAAHGHREAETAQTPVTSAPTEPGAAAQAVAAQAAVMASSPVPQDTPAQNGPTLQSNAVSSIQTQGKPRLPGQAADAAKAKAATKATAPAATAALAAPATGAPTEPSGKAASKAATPAAPIPGDAASSSAQVAAGDAGQGRDSGNGEARSGQGRQVPAASHAGHLAKEASGTLEESNPLAEIVRSLPPVIQSELATGGPAAAVGPAPSVGLSAVPSTGALLNGQVIDMGVQGQWIDRMAQEIASLADGSGHSRFQLSPPNLGRIQVDLWQGNDATHVRLMTETDEAARRLREGQGSLEAHARVASLSLGSISVEKANSGFDSGRDQSGAQNQRQNAGPSGQGQDQAGGQAQDQSAASRNALNRSGLAAVIGNDRQAEPATVAPAAQAADPRIRFA